MKTGSIRSKIGRSSLILAIIFIAQMAWSMGPSFEQREIGEVGWYVEFLGSSYDGAADKTSFDYRVTVASWEKNLNQWVLGCIPEDGQVPVAIPEKQAEFMRKKNESTTGIAGLKWDGGQRSGTKAKYSVVLDGFWTEDINEYSVGGEAYFAVNKIIGCGEKIEAVDQFAASEIMNPASALHNGVELLALPVPFDTIPVLGDLDVAGTGPAALYVDGSG